MPRAGREHDPLPAGPRRSLQVLDSEHDNLRAGLAWALRRDPQAALRLATRLWRFWLDRGYFAEGNRWLQTTLAAAPEQTPLRVEALLAGAGLSLRLGDPNGFLRHVSDAVSAYRLLGDERATAAALYQHAMLAQFVHRADAEALFAEALALARRLGDDRLLAVGDARVGDAAVVSRRQRGRSRARARGPRSARRRARRRHAVLRRGDLRDVPARGGADRRPRMFWEETVFLFHRFARAQAIAYALNNLAWVDARRWRPRAGAGHPRRCARALPEPGGPAGRGADPRASGQPRALAGRLRGRARRLEEALTIRSDLGDRRAMLSTRIGLGLLAMTAGDAPAGRALLSAALAHLEAVDDLPAMAGVQTNWAIGEERLGELQQAARLYEDGCALLGLQRLQRLEAWSRLALHDVCVALGDEPRAQTALQRARALFVAVGDARGVPYTDAKPALQGQTARRVASPPRLHHRRGPKDMTPNQESNPASFYASPQEARQARPEEFLYLACLHEGTGVDAPDFLAVVDAEEGRIVHETPMPNVGDELHHFGWNRCSSACHGPDRSHLIVPGFRSSRIHIVNVADDPRRPRIEKVIEPEELVEKTGYTRPHTVHCMPGDNVVVSMLGDARRQRRRRLRGARRADVRGQGPLGERRRDAAAQLRLLVPAAQERADLVRVRRAQRLRERLRHRGRRRRPLRAAAALLGPRRARGSSRRSTSARTGWSRSRCAGCTTPTPSRASSARRCPATSSASTAPTAASGPSR